MILLQLIFIVVVIGLAAALLVSRLDLGIPAPVYDRPHEPLPERPVSSVDLSTLRFSVVLRGYRMSEVDAVISRLQAELENRELGGKVAATSATTTAPAAATPRVAAAPAATEPEQTEPDAAAAAEPETAAADEHTVSAEPTATSAADKPTRE